MHLHHLGKMGQSPSSLVAGAANGLVYDVTVTSAKRESGPSRNGCIRDGMTG